MDIRWIFLETPKVSENHVKTKVVLKKFLIRQDFRLRYFFNTFDHSLSTKMTGGVSITPTEWRIEIETQTLCFTLRLL